MGTFNHDLRRTELVHLQIDPVAAAFSLLFEVDSGNVELKFFDVASFSRVRGRLEEIREQLDRLTLVCWLAGFERTSSKRSRVHFDISSHCGLMFDCAYFIEIKHLPRATTADASRPTLPRNSGGFEHDFFGAELVGVDIRWPALFQLVFECGPPRWERVEIEFFQIDRFDEIRDWLTRLRDRAESKETRPRCDWAGYGRTSHGTYAVEFRMSPESDLTFECGEFRESGRVRVSPDVELSEPVDPQCPLAAVPHRCHQCHAELIDDRGEPLVIDALKSMETCHACGRRTSVFAIPHRCPGCLASLESTVRAAGSECTCPACGERSRVPHDVLVDPEKDAEYPRQPFVVACPDCEAEWVADQEDVDRHVVCRGCRTSFAIPRAGEATVVASSPVTNLGHCSNCGLPIPAAAKSCPYCGRGP